MMKAVILIALFVLFGASTAQKRQDKAAAQSIDIEEIKKALRDSIAKAMTDSIRQAQKPRPKAKAKVKVKAKAPAKAKASAKPRPKPGSIEDLQSRGDHEYNFGNPDSALTHYSAIKNIKPRYTKNDARIGMLHSKKKNYGQAVRFLAWTGDNDETTLKTLADCYVNLKQGAKAIGIYQRLIKMKPDDKSLAKKIYEAYEALKVNDAVLLDAYQSYLKIEPGDNIIQLKAAHIEAKSKDPAKRAKALEKILLIRPKDVPVMIDLGKLYLAVKKNDKAVALLEKAIRLERKNTDLLALLDEAYAAAGNKKAMIKTLEKRISLEKSKPAAAGLHKQAGALYLELKETSKALSHYEAYTKHKPGDIPVLKKMLALYRADKNRKKERTVLAALIKFQPRKIEHWQARGDLELSLGNNDSALANYLAIKNIRPQYTKNDVKIGKI